MATESEQLMIQNVLAGGDAADRACREFVIRYEGRLTAYIGARVRDPATVDDLVQETLIGFLRGCSNFDPKRDLQSWLFSIASYKVTDYFRRTGRRPAQTGAPDDDDPIDRIHDEGQRPASSIARSRERLELETRSLANAIRTLLDDLMRRRDYKRVMVLELLFVKGVPNQKIAEQLGLNDQQVANYRFNAVKKLTQAIEDAGLPVEVFPELAAGE